jgi:hypothetical protein
MQGVATCNAAVDLIDRNLAAGRGPKPAFIDDRGCYNYAELADWACLVPLAAHHRGRAD